MATNAAQLCILIVDDSPTIVDMLRDLLHGNNFSVLIATNGHEAIKQANEGQPDLIILDIMMPDIDGFETCRRLKLDEKTRDIPVIFMTALSTTGDKVKGFELGAVDYITKPVQPAELLARINTHLSIRKLQLNLQEQNKALQEENFRRRRVQDALRESRERYRLLAENSTDLISQQTPEGIYRYVSPACHTLLGFEIEEMIGKSALDFVHPDDLPDVQPIIEVNNDSPPVATITYRARRKNNSYIWLETTAKVIREEDSDTPLEVIAVSRDVTERKEAEEALQKAHDELEIRVAERTAQLAKLNQAYGRFVPHEFLRFLERESIIEVHLGDQVQREMTILFSDIRSFTALSESMMPQENFNFLNAYLSRVSPIIREHHGFIDKYIGDAMMALFPDKVEDALQAAIAMRQAVSRYNVQREAQGRKPIEIGIGLHKGWLMLGTIGEQERMEGTVISDAVNLASRLEGLTKLYGVSIIVSEQALFSLYRPTRYTFRFLDRVQVQGKKETVAVFEIFDGDPPEMVELKLKTQPDFERGLLHYHSQEFARAKGYFEEVVAKNPQDKAAYLYLKRTRDYLQYGVPVDWQGIEAITDK